MKRDACGFTLLETIIALALSGIILTLLARSLANTYRIDYKSQALGTCMRTKAQMLDVLMKDINSACMTREHLVQRAAIEQNNAGTKHGPGAFVLKASDVQIPREGKRHDLLFESLDFVSMHTLQFGMQRQPVPVRIGYRLIREDSTSQDAPLQYRLERYESSTRQNPLAKTPEASGEIRKVVVAEHIRSFSLRAVRVANEANNAKEHASFLWGNDDLTRYILPSYIEIALEFADDLGEKKRIFNGLEFIIAIAASTANKYKSSFAVGGTQVATQPISQTSGLQPQSSGAFGA